MVLKINQQISATVVDVVVVLSSVIIFFIIDWDYFREHSLKITYNFAQINISIQCNISLPLPGKGVDFPMLFTPRNDKYYEKLF